MTYYINKSLCFWLRSELLSGNQADNKRVQQYKLWWPSCWYVLFLTHVNRLSMLFKQALVPADTPQCLHCFSQQLEVKKLKCYAQEGKKCIAWTEQ
jgi:hypothetical protein